MKLLFVLICGALGAIGAVLALKLFSKGRRKRGAFIARNPVTANEQGMYWRLIEAFPLPEYVVLAQVSFGALLTAKAGASRYSFSQKMADFVLLTKAFQVLAVIELDDASHKTKEAADASRDAMLTEAGYRVLRYPRIPDINRLKIDLNLSPPKIGVELQ